MSAERSLDVVAPSRAGFRAQGRAMSLAEAGEASDLYSRGLLLNLPAPVINALRRVIPRNPRLITVFEKQPDGTTQWTTYDVPEVK